MGRPAMPPRRSLNHFAVTSATLNSIVLSREEDLPSETTPILRGTPAALLIGPSAFAFAVGAGFGAVSSDSEPHAAAKTSRDNGAIISALAGRRRCGLAVEQPR